MECEKAKRLIVDFFYDDIEPDDTSGLNDHLARCDACSEYKNEIELAIKCLDQQGEVHPSVDLATLHEAIEKKRNRTWNPLKYRLPVWATALFVLFGVVLSTFALSKAEFQYGNNTLTISFGNPVKEQPKASVDQGKLYAEIDKLAKKTAYTLEQYKKNQLSFQEQLTKELSDSRTEMARLIGEYEQRNNQRTANLIQQMQLQHYQSLVAIKNEFETLSSQTETEFKRSYMTMAVMAEALSYNSGGN